MDSQSAIAGVCSWIKEARLLVLHRLGYTDADHTTLSSDWLELSKRKQNDVIFEKDFDCVVQHLFGLRPDEWKVISYEFYHIQHRGVFIHERPPVKQVLQCLTLLPAPFCNDEDVCVFQKLIQHAAQHVQTAEQVCACVKSYTFVPSF